MMTHNTLKSLTQLMMVVGILMLQACTTSTGPEESAKVVRSDQSSDKTNLLPDIDQALYEGAIEALSLDRLANAEYSLNKLIKKHPDHFGINLNLAILHFKNKDTVIAQEYIDNAKKIDKRSPALNNLIGLIAVENKEFELARDSYEYAIKQNKNFANAHYNLALLNDIYFQNIQSAYDSYLTYLKLNPDDETVKDWVEQLKYSLERE